MLSKMVSVHNTNMAAFRQKKWDGRQFLLKTCVEGTWKMALLKNGWFIFENDAVMDAGATFVRRIGPLPE